MCDEKKRNKFTDMLKEQNIISSEFIKIPESAYLVVGASLGEDKSDRFFYDDPCFYMIGLDICPEIQKNRNRFISSNITESFTILRLGHVFCKKFETVVIDFQVNKFFIDGPGSIKAFIFLRIIQNLLKMIKPGGKLIFLKDHIIVDTFLELFNNPLESEFKIEGVEIEIKPVNETIDENYAAEQVYSALLTKNLSEKVFSINMSCVIFTINSPTILDTTLQNAGKQNKKKRQTKKKIKFQTKKKIKFQTKKKIKFQTKKKINI
jgi:hypothetical protein